MTRRGVVTGRYDDKVGQWCIVSPYSARHTIKAAVPAKARTWDGVCWRVDGDWLDTLARALERDGYDVRLPTHGATPGDWVDTAFRQCPPSGVGRLRTGLLRVFHPDAGGSPELAKAINVAADRALAGRR